MSGWELMTWCGVATLALGPPLVLVAFLCELPALWRHHRSRAVSRDDPR
jgi:hypothetical protein